MSATALPARVNGMPDAIAADPTSAPSPHSPAARTAPAAALALTTALAACGGGGGGTGEAIGVTPAPVTEHQAARFLAQASMGATREQIARVQALGYAGWLDDQFAMPRQGSRWDWLLANGYGVETNRTTLAGFDGCAWHKLIGSPDTLRQRVTLALSEILVVSIDGLGGSPWRAFGAAAYLDLLEEHAFGNYRTLLEAVSTHPAMGQYLTFRGNRKANPGTGALPDENYARELMQLFTIGLHELAPDGSLRLQGGQPQETYTQADIAGLARVFTGWERNTAAGSLEQVRVPMVQIASRYETGAKSFLGTTIAGGTDAVSALRQALDAVFAHPNVAPFVSRQLIQRLVTSNPGAAYVGRVATVFENNGAGVKGDLRAVVRAILLDAEARGDAGLAQPAFGKLREPMLRFVAWARAFNADSVSGQWSIGNTSDAGTRLGQSPLRSPSVFNFFRPGYVPPNSAIGTLGLVAPEFQITNESSVVGYVNTMQAAVAGTGIGRDLRPDYTGLLALAGDSAGLVAELNTVLAAGALGTATLSTIRTALDSISAGTETGRRNRVHAALTLVLASPEFIAQK